MSDHESLGFEDIMFFSKLILVIRENEKENLG